MKDLSIDYVENLNYKPPNPYLITKTIQKSELHVIFRNLTKLLVA